MGELDLSNIKTIIQSLKDGIKEYRDSDKFKEMLDTMAKFYRYSYGNMILIMSQRPTATYCGSMKFWNSMGRYVKRGEKGIKIICPAPYIQTVELADNKGRLILDENGKPKTKEELIMSFKVGNTFDISQTYGKELNLGCKELVGEGLNTKDFFVVMKEIANVNEIKLETIENGAKGWFNPIENNIVIKEGMSDLQTTKTVIDETAHSVVFSDDETAKTFNRSQHEIIAESVAYVVCKRFNLDTSDYSFNYINGWAHSNDSEIEKCIDCIAQTSTNIISKMENKLGLKPELEVKKELYNSNSQKKVKSRCYGNRKNKQKEMK